MQQDVFEHKATGIRVWTEAVDFAEGALGIEFLVVFHYTSKQGFSCITYFGNGSIKVRATFMHQKGASGVLDAFYGVVLLAHAVFQPSSTHCITIIEVRSF